MCYQHFGAVPQIQLTNTFLNDKALCFVCRTFYNLKKKTIQKMCSHSVDFPSGRKL